MLITAPDSHPAALFLNSLLHILSFLTLCESITPSSTTSNNIWHPKLSGSAAACDTERKSRRGGNMWALLRCPGKNTQWEIEGLTCRVLPPPDHCPSPSHTHATNQYSAPPLYLYLLVPPCFSPPLHPSRSLSLSLTVSPSFLISVPTAAQFSMQLGATLTMSQPAFQSAAC